MSAACCSASSRRRGDHPDPDRDRLDLLDGEGERRQVVALPENVTNARRPFDRDVSCLQGRDIAIDRSGRHLQAFRQRACSEDLGTRPQRLNDFEQPVRSTHRFCRSLPIAHY